MKLEVVTEASGQPLGLAKAGANNSEQSLLMPAEWSRRWGRLKARRLLVARETIWMPFRDESLVKKLVRIFYIARTGYGHQGPMAVG